MTATIETALLRIVFAPGRLPRWLRSTLLDARAVAKPDGRCALVVVPSLGRSIQDAVVVLRYGDFVALHTSVLDRPAKEQLKLLAGGGS